MRAFRRRGSRSISLAMVNHDASADADLDILAEKIVGAINAIFGVHPGYRATHAKGVIYEGTFTPSKEAAAFSRAAHFQAPVPITVRFSANTGVPNIPDADPNASPQGMAVRFHVQGGGETDIVAHSFNGFPVGNGEDFLAFLQAIAQSGAGTEEKPSPIEKFLSSHPAAAHFVLTAKPLSTHCGSDSYFGVNAFRFVNAAGQSAHARLRLHPVAGEQYIPDAELAALTPNHRFEAFHAVLAQGPCEYRFIAEVANPDDPINDASVTWPAERPKLTLGILSIARKIADSDAVQRRLIFDPTHLVDGIELSSDPLPALRSRAYGVSYRQRDPSKG